MESLCCKPVESSAAVVTNPYVAAQKVDVVTSNTFQSFIIRMASEKSATPILRG